MPAVISAGVAAAFYTAVVGTLIGLQTFWISRSLGSLEGRLNSFREEVHRDMTTHTEAIADLRERVARLEA